MSDKVGNVSRRVLSGVFAFFTVLDFKFLNHSKKRTENVNRLIMFYAFFWVIPGVWSLYADVSEHCLFHLHRHTCL